MAGSVEGYYAIAGCSTPTDQTNRGCDPDGTVTWQLWHMPTCEKAPDLRS